jgi:RNA-directed DNA polymerase
MRLEESVEEREATKENSRQAAALRTQSRVGAPFVLSWVREATRRSKEVKFTALMHHLTPARLTESFQSLNRRAAPGVDGETWQEYGAQLVERIRSLHERVHRGTYHALPSRRAYIAKPDGGWRPLGVAAVEDKVVQHALTTVLTEIYEADFIGFSYGYRPQRGAHDGLDALSVSLMHRKVNFVLDADIRGYFDTINHGHLRQFLEQRIGDRRVLRLIEKWLRAGVLERGEWSNTDCGTAQGAVISPLLANVYLHYVLDTWAHVWRRTNARGEVYIVRYADDFVVGFQYRDDAERFHKELVERMQAFGLELHPTKTRLIEFGRFAAASRERRGLGKPETFNFLGFTHSCSKTWARGRFQVLRRTIAKRLRTKLQEIKAALRERMHQDVEEQGKWLRSVLRGYYNYFAVPGNMARLRGFWRQVARTWLRVLRRRSQRSRLTWRRYCSLVNTWLPPPSVIHPYPEQRFYVKHPR